VIEGMERWKDLFEEVINASEDLNTIQRIRCNEIRVNAIEEWDFGINKSSKVREERLLINKTKENTSNSAKNS
jgi:hypothetical protein